MLDGVRDDRALDCDLERRPLKRRGAVDAQSLDQRFAAAGEGVAQSDCDVPNGAAALQFERRTGPTEGPGGLGNDEAAEGCLETRAGGIRHGGRLCGWS